MSDTAYDTTEEVTNVGAAGEAPKPEVPEARKALVKEWCERVKSAKEHKKIKKAFERMRKCMKIATYGVEDMMWLDSDQYVVPIIKRHINQAVSTLYARNPKSIAKRKDKLLYQIWDGDPSTLQTAMASLQPPTDPMTGQPAVAEDPMTGQMVPVPPQIDPQAMALIQEVQAVRQQIIMYDRLGKTMQLLFQYFLDEQDAGYKEQVKAMVRRAKVNGAAYVKLGFQRQLKKNPDIDAEIADVTDQIARIEALMQMAAGDDFDKEGARAEELRLSLADLQSKAEIIVREGPVLSFPKSTEIIPDPKCRHLKTFAGCGWVAHEYDMSYEDVLETYGINLKKGDFTAYSEKTRDKADESADLKGCVARIWEIQDKKNGQALTVCDGYADFFKEPAEPDVKVERFWTIFPLVFNEVESEDEIFPPSDVWDSRHMQREYNSQRQGLREHRIASRPRYVTPRGKLEETDKANLSNGAAHTLIEIDGFIPGENVERLIQRVPSVPIDQVLYETESVFQDVQRAVGSQEANLGGTSGATATETSIAENSRMAASADNTDDLDTLLTELSRAMGQLMLLELDIDTVREIAGPGAVWPQMPPSREEIAKDLILTIEAGSSGRPNKAAELANMERAAPILVQLPGVNPVPLSKKYLSLLDIDLEDALVEGMPSIQALNHMMGQPPMSADPDAQGPQGADNSPRPAGDEAGSQPAYPAPGGGQSVQRASV